MIAAPETAYSVRSPAPLSEVARLVEELRVHPLLASTVWARGLRERVVEQLAAPLTLAPVPGLRAAAERLAVALERRERVLLHGDYDADGVTATALMTLGLRALGARVTPFVPDRLSDGYGISRARVPEHAAQADLFVTLDCGIGDVQEIAALRAAGLDVIVTDHHLSGSTLPDALVVHPRDAAPGMTGAGLAYHLLWALHELLGLQPPSALTDLAAIGTIADVAPLLGHNRSLVREGLERLADSERPGLRALVALSKLRGPLTARHVAFVLGPRLNAAGRLGRADVALELLLTHDERRGRVLATLLESFNEERRRLQESMFEQAKVMADDSPALVLRHPEWHPGVMGIVASQLLERYHKPVFVVAKGKGSVRAPEGLSAVAALQAAHEHLVRWGGHAAAAGFSLDESRFEAFREAVCAHVAEVAVPPPSLTADALLHPSQVDADLHSALQALEPYGVGHEEPLFALASRLDQVRSMGQAGKHLQTSLEGVRAVGWGLGHLAERWRAGESGVGLATVTTSTFRERTSVELRIRGLARSGGVALRGAGTNGRLHIGSPQQHGEGVTVVRAIEPSEGAPLAPLSSALGSDEDVYLDLGESGPSQLRRLAAAFPRVSDARRAFVLSKRGRPWPWRDELAERLRRVLTELDLLDERGRARAGLRVDPYDSPSLRAALVARHALESLATFIEALPPEEAARAVADLLGKGRVAPTADSI